MQGGQGTIDIKVDNGVQYACKHLIAGEFADSDSVHRFEREIRIAEKIDSPNVIKILGHGKDENGYFYNMPVYKMNLSQFISYNYETLFHDPAIQKTIFLSILSGVEALHRSGIIHRDLKPGNILMNDEYEIAVCDFGFSKDLDTSVSYTSTGDAFGTPRYISPEQAADSKHVDIRTDIFALGHILNDLSGRMTGLVPLQIQRIADKATAYNPDDRYNNVSELKDDVVKGYNVWLRFNSGLSVKQMIDEISSGKIDGMTLLGYVNIILNNPYYTLGDANELSGNLSEKQYTYLENENEDLCMKMFEHIWDDFHDTWNRVFSKIDEMASFVNWYWGISKSPNIKGYLLGELADIAKEGNRFAAMETMADLISEIANDPLIKNALLSYTSRYTIKENYKIIGKTPPTWL